MDMRPDKDCSDRARDSAEEMRLPRDAGLARENAPENGAIEDTDHQCRAQGDQRAIQKTARDEEAKPAEDQP